MRVLVACEESQAVTIELRRLGHEAYSCDIQPCSGGHPEWHIMGDVLPLIREGGVGHDNRTPAVHISDRRGSDKALQQGPHHRRPGTLAARY